MEKMIQCWKLVGIWNKITSVKVPFIEPKDADAFKELYREFSLYMRDYGSFYACV